MRKAALCRRVVRTPVHFSRGFAVLPLFASVIFGRIAGFTRLFAISQFTPPPFTGIYRLGWFGVPTVAYAAAIERPSCSQELATSQTVARCTSRFHRKSSNSVPRCMVQRLSHMTRSWTRQRCV
jgi:hypothetical protein